MMGAPDQPQLPGRYLRQERIEWIGAAGQARIRASHAAIVGCGALGCAAADILARAGIGRLTLIDRDVVEPSNLQRQSLFCESDARARRPKAEAARDRLHQVNAEVTCRAWVDHLCAENALDYLAGADIIIDGLDNIRSRMLLNDVAVQRGIPYIYGGAVALRGCVMPVLPGEACLRCAFPHPFEGAPQPTCDTAGVLMATVLAVAARQTTLALQWLSGSGALLPRALWSFDAADGRATSTSTLHARDPHCCCCGKRVFDFLDGRSEDSATVLCGRNAVQIVPPGTRPHDALRLHESLSAHGAFEMQGNRLVGRIEAPGGAAGSAIELTVFGDGRAIIGGTTDPVFARSVYDRFVGGA